MTLSQVLRWTLMLAVLSLLAGQVVLTRRDTFKVLVIHSYNTDLPWVGDVNAGIDRALAARPTRMQVRRHYMNLLSHPDCNHFRLAAEDARLAIDDWRPDAIVLVDDLAQALVGFPALHWRPGAPVGALRDALAAQLALDRCPGRGAAFFGLDHPPQSTRLPPLFFAGVNGDVDRYGYHAADNVSGIYEHKSFAALAETLTAVRVASSDPAAYVQPLNDSSASSLAERDGYVASHIGNWLPPRNVRTFEQWKTAVQEASVDNAMLLIANYQNLADANEHLVPAREVVAWTESHSRQPAIGAATDYVTDGGLMTLAISGTEQGEAAMEMLLDYRANGRMPPERTARRFLVGMNPALMRKRALRLPAIYEAFAREQGRFLDVSEHVYLDDAALAGTLR